MNMDKRPIIFIGLVSIVLIALILLGERFSQSTIITFSPSPTASTSLTSISTPIPISTNQPTPLSTIVVPIAEFKERITKKTFGMYITPATSPVQPERFSGYHTGVDVEYGDVNADVPIYAVADGTVVKAQWVSGYGGLLVLQTTIKDQALYILYGHLRQSSLPAQGSKVTQGQQVGVLGTANSHETDGERKHLHFAVYAGNNLDIRGYVPNKSDLSAWRNPLDFY